MQNYLHAYEINREAIFIIKIKHICLTKAQNQGYLKFSIKLYYVNTQHESALHTGVFMESNIQNDKLMGYYGQTNYSILTSYYYIWCKKTTGTTNQDLLRFFHISFLLLYHFAVT